MSAEVPAKAEISIDQSKLSISWKQALALGAAVTVVAYPEIFLWLLQPVIKRISKAYASISKNEKPSQILLLTHRVPISKLIRLPKIDSSLEWKVLDYLAHNSSNLEICELWAENIYSKILQSKESEIVVVYASPRIIQNIEMRMYKMEPEDRHKLSILQSSDSAHLLRKLSDSYELIQVSLADLGQINKA